MRTYPKKLMEYGISEARYIELVGFCRQYREWKKRLGTLIRSGRSVIELGHSGGMSDPTSRAALERIRLTAKCMIVEQAAIEAAPEYYRELIRYVTEKDETYYNIHPPCGKNQFSEVKLRFFVILDGKQQCCECTHS